MFTFEKMVDTAVAATKQGLEQFPEFGLKKELANLVDAQAVYAKTFYSTTRDMTKYVVDTYSKYDTFGFAKNFTSAK